MFREKLPRKESSISGTEKALGAAILVLLAIIAAAVWARGRHYDPALFQMSAASAERAKGVARDVSTAGPEVPVGAETPDLKDRTYRTDRTYGSAAGASSAPNLTAASNPAKPLAAHSADADKRREGVKGIVFAEGKTVPSSIEGGAWTPMDPPASFGPDNLFEKIDGGADQYLSLGFQELQSVCFVDAKNPASMIDVYVYDQGAALNAFGLYAAQRPPDVKSIPLGREGYGAEGALFFWKGRYCVQIVPSLPDAAANKMAERIAWAIEERLQDNGELLPFDRLLPSEDRIAQSEEFQLQNALGQSFLKRLFLARYKVAGAALKAFASQCDSEAEARKAFEQYKAYLAKSGKPLDVPEDMKALGCAAATIAGAGEIAFVQGPFFAGVTGAEKPDAALEFVRSFAKTLKSAAAKEF